MSGGWTSDDRAIVRNNLIRRNDYLELPSRGGVGVSTSNDITVEGNTFGDNEVAGVNVIYDADRDPPQPDARGVLIEDNTMNGDATLGCSLAGVICRNN
jgi:hypothetical protein